MPIYFPHRVTYSTRNRRGSSELDDAREGKLGCDAAIPYRSNRTVQLLSRIFPCAKISGLRPDDTNLCRQVNRFVSDQEYRRLRAVVKQSEKQGREPPLAIAAIQRLILTACRKAEIWTRHCEHVDLNARKFP